MNSRRGFGLLRIHALDQHFTHVNPDPNADRMTFLGESPKFRLNQERELDRIRRFAEDDEKRVARRFDLLTFLKARQCLTDQPMMPFDESDGLVITQLIL